jgi:hypothetical protein
MSILEEKIQDRRFTDLIRKALNAGHFNYDLSNFSSLHPILIDIF